jgi:hypothetical protein
MIYISYCEKNWFFYKEIFFFSTYLTQSFIKIKMQKRLWMIGGGAKKLCVLGLQQNV